MRQLSLCFQLSPLLSISALSLAWSRESFPFLSPAAKKVVWLQVYQILIYQFKAPQQETEESFVFCGNLDTHEAAKVLMELSPTEELQRECPKAHRSILRCAVIISGIRSDQRGPNLPFLASPVLFISSSSKERRHSTSFAVLFLPTSLQVRVGREEGWARRPYPI